MIQIASAKAPFTKPSLAFQAVTALVRAEAMGLLPRGELFEALDLDALKRVIKHVHRAGIGRAIHLDVPDGGADEGPALERQLRQLNAALEESPAPKYEWNRLADVLGADLLARLIGVSVASVRRYRAAVRSTPDDVAARLHFLTLLVGDLSGAYNDIGVRQWFERKRAQLNGCAPAQLLKGVWDTNAPGPVRVRELARALTGSPAT